MTGFRRPLAVSIALVMITYATCSSLRAQDSPAFGDIITADDALQICKPATGERRADPILLSELILRRFNVSLTVIFAIAEQNRHIPPSELPRSILLEAEPGDPLYVNVDFIDASSAVSIANGIQLINDYLVQESSERPEAVYRVMPPTLDVTEENVDEIRQTLLRGDPSVWLACQREDGQSFLDSPVFTNFRLRGRVADLAIKRPSISGPAAGAGRFNGVEPAEVSLVANEKANQTALATSFVAGYVLEKIKPGEDSFGTFENTYSFIPFVSYDRTDITGNGSNDGDINQITPGIQAAWSSNRRLLGVIEQIALDFSGTLDEEQNARTLGAEAMFNLNPTITSDDPSRGGPTRTSYCFSDLIIGGGPLGIHCTPRAIVNVTHVLDEGTSPDLEDTKDDQFVGLGGEIGVTAFLARTTTFDPGILSGFALEASFRYVGIVSGSLGDQERLRAALSYQFPTVRFLEWVLSYEKGNNIETFQDEELTRLSLGVRF